MDKLKRYIIFLIGLFINSLGVSLITESRTWHFSNLFHSLCIEPNFSFYIRTIYHLFQCPIGRVTAAYTPPKV